MNKKQHKNKSIKEEVIPSNGIIINKDGGQSYILCGDKKIPIGYIALKSN